MDFVRITIAIIHLIFVGFVKRQTMFNTLTNLMTEFGKYCLSNLYSGPGASDKPCNGVYQGASVMSENEVQNVDPSRKGL